MLVVPHPEPSASSCPKPSPGSSGYERMVRESNARLEALIDGGPAVTFVKDGQSRYVRVGQTAGRIFQIRFDATRGEPGLGFTLAGAAGQVREGECFVRDISIPARVIEVSCRPLV